MINRSSGHLKLSGAIILIILLVDQALKFWVKTNMVLGEEFSVAGNWFLIHFTENYGMAFGIEFAGVYGKLVLSIFRIIAVCAIGWYIFKLIRQSAHVSVVTGFSLILAGAIGNIIDSTFYGLLFSDSYHQVAGFLPDGGGYAGLLHGKVVDMFYFPLIYGYFPDWFPVWAGDEFIFFRPVFNIADSSITVGVAVLLLFQKHFNRIRKN
ncbi:MAG: lipoprotein signal peptidase [Bacteroidetes bacterium]|nr:lipoprotein signal peptidase [Bacteroidota bacterium]